MKKKLFVLFLAFAMVFAFTACGGGVSSSDDGTGSVYWLNMKPEADEALQGLAAAYTEETGVPCKVVTAASGSYSDTQTAEMAKSEPPTLFNVGNMSALNDWDDYCLPLDGTDFMNELTTTDFNLKNEAGETLMARPRLSAGSMSPMVSSPTRHSWSRQVTRSMRSRTSTR